MKAFSIESPGVMRMVELDKPMPAPGEVAIDVQFVGYCGSDLTSFRGLNPLINYPKVPGHEISGIISELGTGVENLELGQQVTILPYFNCGQCNACRMGKPNACKHNQTMGVQREGALTSTVVVPAAKIIPVHGISPRDLALVEPCAVGFHAVRRAEVTEGETVVVLGSGMIGLGVLMGAVRRKARVIAVDLSPAKLEVARRLGAAETIDAGKLDVVAEIARLTGDDGPNVVIEAVGADATFRQAVDIVASCGRVVYVGYAKAPIAYETKKFLMKEIDIRGSRGALRADFEDVIEYLQARPDTGDQIVSRIVTLAQAGKAMADWDAKPADFLKILVDLRENT